MKTEPQSQPQPQSSLAAVPPPEHLTDQEWLETLPLYHVLSGKPLKLFCTDALLYRKLWTERKNAAERYQQARQELEAAPPDDAFNFGSFGFRLFSWIRSSGPEKWVLCPADHSHRCKRCNGNRYTVPMSKKPCRAPDKDLPPSPAPPPDPPPPPEVVAAILAGRAAGRTSPELAAEFGLSKTKVRKIFKASPLPPPPQPAKPKTAKPPVVTELPPPPAKLQHADSVPIRSSLPIRRSTRK